MTNRATFFLVCIGVLIGITVEIISAPIALLMGIILGITNAIDQTIITKSTRIQKILLQITVVGLGFGLQLSDAMEIGSKGIIISLITIILTFTIAFTLRFILKSDQKLTMLIASGTAICGGSAIAAISPTIRANPAQTSISLAVVFVLNAIALFIFPTIGHYFNLGSSQFGIWCALAIHDTSSVVGASQAFGEESMVIATTAKLVRALWIVPLALGFSFLFKSTKGVSIPWFIGGFVLVVLLSSMIPAMDTVSQGIVWLSRKLLVFIMFLIGIQISIHKLKQLGTQSIVLGIITWLALAAFSLLYVIKFV